MGLDADVGEDPLDDLKLSQPLHEFLLVPQWLREKDGVVVHGVLMRLLRLEVLESLHVDLFRMLDQLLSTAILVSNKL